LAVDCQVPPDDCIGVRLCSAISDAIARSPRYREINHARWQIIRSFNLKAREKDPKGPESFVPACQELDRKLMDQDVFTLHSDGVDEWAQTVFAETDNTVKKWRRGDL
jgi:hypothetical protein